MADAAGTFRIHLLDVGPEKFGDCILCEVGGKTVLIDGSHPSDFESREGFPSIPDQLAEVLGHAAPFDLDLLVCTHAHVDHIGCLPTLVHGRTIRPKFAIVADPQLGWGRSGGDAPFDAGLPDAARPMAAALREESRADVGDAELRHFLADAMGLEDRYKQMVAELGQQGVTVARYGRDDAGVADIVSKFKSVGLKILGPTQEQLARCAEVIRQVGRDAAQDAAAMMADGADALQAYRLAAAADAASDGGSVGAALNNQSIVLRLAYQGGKALLTGDMQFVKPQVSTINDLMADLLRAVAGDGPYGFVKLGHHASFNAVDDHLLDALGAPWLGISTGRNGADHPNPAVLKILAKRKSKSSWLRTDKNGRCTFEFTGTTVSATKARGRKNDATPKTGDVPMSTPSAAPPGPGPAGPLAPAFTTESSPTGNGVEVIVRIPHGTQLDVSMTLSMTARRADGGGGPNPPSTPEQPGPTPTRPGADAVTLAGGRAIPPLLFVTSREALARNVGDGLARATVDAIRAAGKQVVDDIPAGATVLAATEVVRDRLRRQQGLRGVVIVGGYDVVPSAPVDALDAGLRRDVAAEGFSDKEDNFIVWNDDLYGDVEGDLLPELPVSRVPDAGSRELLLAALQASPGGAAGRRFGVRNAERPFAQPVFLTLPGNQEMLVSGPSTAENVPADGTSASRMYVMLHGHYLTPGEFAGEAAGDYPVAFTTRNIGPQSGEVVFAGCCWGGLSVDRPAAQVVGGAPFRPRTVDESIALTFLRNGALAFVGCTGMHYSPLVRPFRHHGGRMHSAFWAEIARGTRPAEALFNAKAAYAREIPVAYGQPLAPSDVAIERKIWRQYTCLGLGW